MCGGLLYIGWGSRGGWKVSRKNEGVAGEEEKEGCFVWVESCEGYEGNCGGRGWKEREGWKLRNGANQQVKEAKRRVGVVRYMRGCVGIGLGGQWEVRWGEGGGGGGGVIG